MMSHADGLSLKVERQRRLERIKQKQSQLQELILQVTQRLPWGQWDCRLLASAPLRVFALVSEGVPGRAAEDAQGGLGGRWQQVWVRVNRASF